MNEDDLFYLIKRANREGAKGNRVVEIVLPTSATQGIEDTVFVVDRPQQASATDSLWYK